MTTLWAPITPTLVPARLQGLLPTAEARAPKGLAEAVELLHAGGVRARLQQVGGRAACNPRAQPGRVALFEAHA